MKRQRGRGRKPGGGGGGHHNNQGHHQPNRTLESNGPEGKVRGPAALICERYLQLARDAYSSGDRVLAENFFQHADHYFRLMRAMQPAAPPPSERFTSEAEYEEGDDEGAAENEPAVAAEPPRRMAEATEPGETAGGEAGQGDRGEGDFRRRRGRRNRFRPGGGEEGMDEPRQAREPREPRENGERAPENSAEGFSGSPRPAFLRPE